MPSQEENTRKITAAQELFNTELANLAAALGVPVPALAGEYEASRYDQIAGQAERNARALAKVNADYAERLTPADDGDDPADDGDPTRPAIRRGRKPNTDNG